MKLDRLFVDLPLDKVRVSLLALARRLDGGFTGAEAEQFCADLARLETEDDLLLERTVLVGGFEAPFVIDVLGHDKDAFSLAFIAPRMLAALVQEEIRAACGVTTIRVIPGESAEFESALDSSRKGSL